MLKNWRKRSKRGYFVRSTPKYEVLLEDQSVQKWILNLKKRPGWRKTVPSFLRTLQSFSDYVNKRPNELIALALGGKKTEIQKKLVPATPAVIKLAQRFINELLNSGKREKARLTRTCLISFFKANGISLEIESIPRTEKEKEVVLTKEQIYAMVDNAGSLRNRAIILCMYQSGLGVTAIRSLNYGHVKEQLERERVPIRIRITSRISKKVAQVPYYAFFGSEACDALKAYIEERKRKIQKMKEKGVRVRELSEKSPLFASEGKNVPFGERMAISSIWRVIKEAAERAGLDKESIKPNSIRKAFEMELNRAKIDEETKLYLMGRPVPSVKYDIDRIEQKYLMCNFGREEINKIKVIKEFVQSFGIKGLDAKIQRVLQQNPNMTEIQAIKIIMLEEICASKAELKVA